MAFILKLEKKFRYKLMQGSDLCVCGGGKFWEGAAVEVEGSLTI